MLDFCTHREIVVSQLVRPRLQLLAARGDVLSNLEVLLREVAHLVAEFSGLTPFFNFNLAGQRAELVDIPGPDLILNGQQLQVELLLISLLQKGHQEFARLQHL